MRISDWSSDVCSSDLRIDPPPDRRVIDLQLHRRRRRAPSARHRKKKPKIIPVEMHASLLPHGAARPAAAISRPAILHPLSTTRDRKSVVEGKSVEVRVDPGGRRRTKKKKTKYN